MQRSRLSCNVVALPCVDEVEVDGSRRRTRTEFEARGARPSPELTTLADDLEAVDLSAAPVFGDDARAEAANGASMPSSLKPLFDRLD